MDTCLDTHRTVGAGRLLPDWSNCNLEYIPESKKLDYVFIHRFPTTKSKLRQLMEISNCTAQINAKGMSLFILYLTFCDDLVIPVLNVCFDNSNDSKVAKQ